MEQKRQDMEQELLVQRSAAGCVKAAGRLVWNRRRMLFRRLWLPSLLIAATAALSQLPATKLAGLLLAVACTVWYHGRIMSVLNEKSTAANCRKVIQLLGIRLLAYLLLAAAFFGVMELFFTTPALEPHLPLATFLSAAVCVVLVLLLEPPFSYFWTKYLMEETRLWGSLWPAMKTGLRHWGLLFLSELAVGLLLLLPCAAVLLPALILFAAETFSAEGVALGDAAGLPSSFWLLQAATVGAAAFVIALAESLPVATLYYAYGSVEQKEAARRERDADIA